MVFNVAQRYPTYGITIPLLSVGVDLRVAPDCEIKLGSFVWYGYVNYGDAVVPNWVLAIYPPGYTGKPYRTTGRISGIAAEAADTRGQQYPDAFIQCFMPMDGEYGTQ